MQKSQIIDHGASLFETSGLRATIEAAASNPKVAGLVATSTAGMGAMVKLDVIQGAAATVSIVAGAFTGCIIAIIQLIKLVRVWRSWTPNKPDTKE